MKRKLFAIILFTAVLMLVRIGVSAENSDSIQSLVSEFQKETGCKDVSVVVYENGEASFYGDSGGLYQIGSMTKAFTGLAIQKLIIEGKLSADDKISDLIPGFEAYYGSEKVDITVQNLLDQKSGLTNNEKDYPSATEEMSLEEWAESMSGKELKSAPGSEYSYSNVNYNLLGLMIEKVSGMTCKDYMEKEILDPLGLKNTYVGMPNDDRIIEGARLGYRHAFEYSIPVKEASIPAGYFYSNAEDMAGWIKIWMLEEEVPEEFKEAIKLTKEQLDAEGDYTSGWEMFSDDVIGHSGGTPNYSSRIVFSDKEKCGVCVLTNLNVAASTDSLCNNIFNLLTDKEQGNITTDIWTIFDTIFTVLSIVGILLFIGIFFVKNRIVLWVTDAFLIILLTLILILFPVIFGAGLKAILFTWAPLSLSGGLLIMILNIVFISIKFVTVKKYANHNKAG